MFSRVPSDDAMRLIQAREMMARAFMLACMCVLVSGAQAQTPMTKEATLLLVQENLSEIIEEYRTATSQAHLGHAMASASTLRSALDVAIRRVVALRDSLAGNPYVRVASFSVGFPSGVNVEFQFPPPDEPKQ